MTEHKYNSEQSSVYVGKYINNKYDESRIIIPQHIYNQGEPFTSKQIETHWHTHPAYKQDSNKPSDKDLNAKIYLKKHGITNFNIFTFGYGVIKY